MTIVEMLGQSGILTLLGMGVVFSFLVILVLAVTAMHSVLHALGLDKDKEPEKKPSAASSAPVTDNGAIVAAIAAAAREKGI